MPMDKPEPLKLDVPEYDITPGWPFWFELLAAVAFTFGYFMIIAGLVLL